MARSAAQRFHGISGLAEREPVGAVLTIGRKGPGGAPTDNDRFWIVSRHEQNGVRPLHPAFAAFNGAAPARRQTISGNIVHADPADAAEWRLSAMQLGGEWPNHPQRKPACEGDGVRARRLYAIGRDGEPDDYREIPCPNELCEFRQGNAPKCKPFGRIYFRPRWNKAWEDGGFPTPLMLWANHSWNSTDSLAGFFRHVEHQAEQLGLERWSVYGLPFTLTLGRKTKPQEKRSFPVVSITPDCDLIDFFQAQRARLEAAGGRLMLAAGARDPEEVEAAARDSIAITPGIPGEWLDAEGAGVSAAVEQPATMASSRGPSDDDSVVVDVEFVEHEDGFRELKMTPAGGSSRELGSDDDGREELPKPDDGTKDASAAPAEVTLISATSAHNLRLAASSAGLDADAIAAEFSGSGLAGTPIDFESQIFAAIKQRAAAAAKPSARGRR